MAGESILHVDDEAWLREKIQTFLGHAGYRVTTAADGHEALSLLEAIRPSLILAGVDMPNMNGLELTHRLRNRADTAQIPIILLSGRNQTSDILAGYNEGADEYIAKPVDMDVLLAHVVSALRHAPVVPAAPRGVVSVFVHGKGGVGTTTLVVNTAIALAGSQAGRRVVILDLNLEFGNAEMLLDLHPQRRLTQLAGTDISDLERSEFVAFLEHHVSGVSLLAATESPVDAEKISVSIVRSVIDRLRAEADYIVVDLPANFSDQTLAALDAADATFVVTTPQIAAAKATLDCLAVIDRIHVIPHERLFLVLNRTTNHGLEDQHIRRCLGHPGFRRAGR